MRQKLFAAHIGADVAGELNGFIELYQSLGSARRHRGQPDDGESADGAVAALGGLHRARTSRDAQELRADRRSTPIACRASSRCCSMHDATVREPKLKETAAYSAWAVKNQDLILQS